MMAVVEEAEVEEAAAVSLPTCTSKARGAVVVEDVETRLLENVMPPAAFEA